MRSFFVCTLTILLLAVSGCDEKKSTPVGLNVIDRDFGQIDEVHLKPAVRDTVIQTDIPLYAGPLLLVGEWAGYQTQSLLKFGSLPESVQVTSASVTLITYGVIDTEAIDQPLSPEEGEFLLSFIDSWWDSSSVAFESIPPRTPITTFTMGTSVDDTIALSLPLDRIQGWIDGTIDNYGLLLSYADAPYGSSGSGFIKKFYSSNSQTGPPRMSISWAITDTSDTTSQYFPTADVFVVDRLTDWPFDRELERLMVGNGYAYRSLLQFNIEDSIPSGATVLKGDLTLFIDHEYSFFSSMDIGIYAVTSETWDDPDFDSSQIVWATAEAKADSVVFSIYPLIQDWNDGQRSNYGLMVRSIHEDWDIHSFVFHASTGDSSEQPKLDVVFGMPPDFNPKRTAEVTAGEE